MSTEAKFLRVTYFDNHRNIGNLFFPLKNPEGEDMKDEASKIMGEIVDDGFVWVTESKIIPEHRIFVYEICNEEVKKKVESYKPRYNNNNHYNNDNRFNDSRNDGRNNYHNNYRNSYRNNGNRGDYQQHYGDYRDRDNGYNHNADDNK